MRSLVPIITPDPGASNNYYANSIARCMSADVAPRLQMHRVIILRRALRST